MYGIIKKCIALIVALVYIIGGLVFQTPNLSLWAAAESPSDGIPCPFFFQEEALGPEAVSGPWRYALRLSDGYAVITSCNLDSTSVSIPAILDGHDVVGLSSGSLSGKTQAILHGNILYIAEDTFGNSTPRITALNGTYGQYWAYIHNFPFTTGKDYDLVHGVIDYTDVQQGRIQRRGEEYIAFNRLEALRLSVGSLIWFRDSRGFDSFYRVTELMDSGDQVLAAIQRPDKISDAVINYQNTQEIMMRPSDFVPAEGVLVGSNSSTSKTTAIIPEEEETLFEITPSQFEKKYGNNESSKGKFKASAKGKISTKILYTIKIENGITKTCEMVETETLDIGVTFEAGACTNMLKEHGKAEKIIQDAADGNNPNEEQKNFLKKYLGNDSFSITENGNTGGISGIDIKNMQEILFNKKEKALEESKFKHPMRLGHYHFQTFWFNLTVDFKVNLELSGKATLSSYKSTTTKKHWVPDPNDPDDPEKGEWVIDYSNGNVTTDETGATLKAEGKGKITGEIEVSCGLFFLSDISLKIKGGVEATIECKINYSDGIFDFPCAVVTVSPFLEISAYTGIWVGESTGWKHEIFSKKWTAAQLLGKPHFLQIHAHLKYGSHVPEQCPLNDTCTVKYETKTSTILNDIKLIKNEILSRNINKKLDDHPEYGTFRGWAYNISDTEPTAADVNGEFKFADNGAIEKDQTNGIDRIRILQNLTLYAIWENSAVITFDSAGGTIIEDQCIPVGGYITMPPVPQKEGSIFTGWIIDPSNPRYWDFDRDPVQGDMTLTATWIDGNAPSGGTENVTYIGRLTDVSAESLFFTNHGEIYPGLFQYEIKQVPGSSDAKYIRITGVNNNPEHLIIPNELTILFGDDDSTLPVRDIAEDAFRNCIGLKSVSFKTENVSIDSNFMFYGCTNLEYVELPSLDDGKLGNNAFDGCKNLKCVQFQPGLSALDDCAFDGCEGINGDIDLSELSSVGIATFRNCTGIKSVIIGNKLLSIPDELFSGCSGIEHLDLGNNINTIGNYAFYGCEHINGDIDLSKLSSVGIGAFKNCTGIKSAIIGNNLSLIPNELFSGCNKIEHLSLGKNTNAIGDYAFDGCEGITGDIDLSELSSVGIAAFRNCTGIKSVIIGNKLSSIPNELFSGCSGIEHLDLGNSINAINDWAFKDCTGLKNLYIPDSVKYISARGEKIIQTNYLLSAFRGCNELETISIGGVETVEKNMFPLEKDKVHNLKQVTIRGSVKVIGHNAFSDAGWPVNSFSALTDENNSIEVIIEEGVESIEGGAFHWCSGISYLQLPSTITSIGDYAFEGCTEMQADMDLSHVTTLGEGAFASCDNIRSIDISSATSLGNSVFSYCTSLESVIFNNQLFSIPDNAFSHCTNLKELNIPDSVTELGNAAFSYCTSLTSLYIPDSVAKISTDRDNWTFKNCTGVKTINIGGVETLMPKMLPLYSCETIIVRGSVKHIADEAFSFLTNYSLQDQNNSVIIILDEGIETIGYAAFKNCYGISGIEIPSTITSIGKNAFSNCSNMKAILI